MSTARPAGESPIRAVQPVSGVTDGTPLPVTGPLTDAQLRATAVPIADGGGAITVDGTVGVSGTVTVEGTVTASGPLTDAQLRATAVPVADGGGSITVDGPLTDTQLRATAVPVADGGGSITVDGPLTDTQLRATAVPIADGGGSLTVDGSVSVTGTPTVTIAEERQTQSYNSGAATAAAPADTDILASSGGLNATGGYLYEIAFSLSSSEAFGAGGFVDLVVRNAADNADIVTLATFGASGTTVGRLRYYTGAQSYIVKLRKVGAATAATSYRAALSVRRCN